MRPNSRRAFGHSNTRSTTPSPPRICACEGASKQVDQRGRDAVPELQLSRHNAMPPTCVSQSLQTDERRQARRSERTETHAWADVGAFRHMRRQRTHTCRAALFRWWNKYQFCKTHATVEACLPVGFRHGGGSTLDGSRARHRRRCTRLNPERECQCVSVITIVTKLHGRKRQLSGRQALKQSW